jgi:hypothetical protein
MPSFLSEAEKAEMSLQFNNLHDTFGRNVIIYKESKKVNIFSNENYISIYRNTSQGENFSFSYETVSGTFSMRIKWLDPNEDKNLPIEVDFPSQVCRLKMKKDAFDFLSGNQSLFIDNVSCEVIKGYKPHGLFNIDFYTIYAKRKDTE